MSNPLDSFKSAWQHGPRWVRYGAPVALLAAAGLWFYLTGQGGRHPEVSAPALDPDVVDLSAVGSEALARDWKIQVAPVMVSPYSETLRVTGKVDFDEQHVSRIGASVTGRVTDIVAVPGQTVKRGELLARINSAELGQSQLAYLKARAADELARNAYERAQLLYREDVIAKAELQRRQSEAATARAERRAMSEQLQVLGMTAAQIETLGEDGKVNTLSSVVASVPGVVVERHIVQGQVVQPAEVLFTVADLSEVWVTALVPERDAGLLALGQKMQIEIPALRDAHLEGKLIYVGEMVSPDSRTVPARTSIPNPERQLKPGMLATMLIAGKTVDTPVVPASAVVHEENADYVFVSESPTRFRLMPVRLGPESGGVLPVLSGLKAGTPIAADQAFHLNNERKKRLGGG
ncbi:MAG: efflux RND transporter periplasmic adaptor subunit [Betaproteobacteria bacterium]|nr:efflux RND transporter periplasmic adaptor subunit [Betaproteobacteria bacterium]